ncbi:MAG: acylneuraminate cytidylyltransferase family protein [Turicibacter sp.]|nr:acylneuraminate cytidylyltransferase family protein [Turicibacter sp.]
MKIKALVAVRSGSERVPNKNLRNFSNGTLLKYKLEQLLRISALDGVVVNSNDDTMLDIAKNLGCEVVKREQIFADAKTSMSDVYENMAENFTGDIVVYCNVTNPLISDEQIIRVIEVYLDNEFESVNTAHLVKEFLFLDNKPINYDVTKQPRSQDLPDIYALNFAANVISKEHMIRFKNIISPKCKLLEIPMIEAVDIDTMLDFEVAEYLFDKKLKGIL